MKILILGAYGMLGHKLADVLGADFDVYATCRQVRGDGPVFAPGRLISGVSVEDFASVERAIEAVRPAAVVNCIGVIKQQSAAKDPIPSITINSLFPHHTAAAARKHGARFIHFSTDCVFSGRKGNYSLDDIPDPPDLYGRSKLLGEAGNEGALTIRSSIIGLELGTQLGLIEWFLSQAGQKIHGYKKAIYTGLTTAEMANVVRMLLLRHPGLSGVWQVASQPISKYELLAMLNVKLALQTQIEPDTSFHCDRSLDGSKFSAATGYHAPGWSAMLDLLAAEIRARVK